MSNFNVNNPPGGPYTPNTLYGWLVSGMQFLSRRVSAALAGSGGGGGVTTGTATLSSGTVTVNNAIVKAGDLIWVNYNTISGTIGNLLIAPVSSITAGVSFVINSTRADGTTIQTIDNSTVNYLIPHT